MKKKFDELSIMCSKMTTKKYSTSFSLGVLFLHSSKRDAIYSVYGFVRFADEIVDSFNEYNKKYLLEKFKQDCFEAIEQKISVHPILNAFQKIVHFYALDMEYIQLFFKSMEMDLQKIEYNQEKYNNYILGSAEVVGLMCLQIFTYQNPQQFLQLKPYAMKLGAAFQKVNFLRDFKQDNVDLERMYFPNLVIENFNNETKKAIEENIENDFADALIGIKLLPSSSRAGVYLAYFYYLSLFNKIKKIPAKKVLESRVRISNIQKYFLMIYSYCNVQLNKI